MSNDESKTKFRLPISAYLTYLLVATFLFTGVTFAKYIASSTDGDAARVASFNITSSALTLGSGDNILDSADSEDAVVYSFYVNNTAEVAVSYTVNISGYDNSVDCDVDYPTGEIAPGNRKEVTATFTLDNPASAETCVLDNISVQVTAEQMR